LLGVIGIAYSDYMFMTFVTINAIIKAYRTEQYEQQKLEWERARIIAFYAANPETAKKAGKPDGLIKFPWERSETKPKSLEELKAKFDRIDAQVKKLNG